MIKKHIKKNTLLAVCAFSTMHAWNPFNTEFKNNYPKTHAGAYTLGRLGVTSLYTGATLCALASSPATIPVAIAIGSGVGIIGNIFTGKKVLEKALNASPTKYKWSSRIGATLPVVGCGIWGAVKYFSEAYVSQAPN